MSLQWILVEHRGNKSTDKIIWRNPKSIILHEVFHTQKNGLCMTMIQCTLNSKKENNRKYIASC